MIDPVIREIARKAYMRGTVVGATVPHNFHNPYYVQDRFDEWWRDVEQELLTRQTAEEWQPVGKPGWRERWTRK